MIEANIEIAGLVITAPSFIKMSNRVVNKDMQINCILTKVFVSKSSGFRYHEKNKKRVSKISKLSLDKYFNKIK